MNYDFLNAFLWFVCTGDCMFLCSLSLDYLYNKTIYVCTVKCYLHSNIYSAEIDFFFPFPKMYWEMKLQGYGKG